MHLGSSTPTGMAPWAPWECCVGWVYGIRKLHALQRDCTWQILTFLFWSSGITTILLFVNSCTFVNNVIYCTASSSSFQHVHTPEAIHMLTSKVRLTAASDFIVEALKSLGKDKVSFAYLVTCQMPWMLFDGRVGKAKKCKRWIMMDHHPHRHHHHRHHRHHHHHHHHQHHHQDWISSLWSSLSSPISCRHFTILPASQTVRLEQSRSIEDQEVTSPYWPTVSQLAPLCNLPWQVAKKQQPAWVADLQSGVPLTSKSIYSTGTKRSSQQVSINYGVWISATIPTSGVPLKINGDSLFHLY